MDGYSSNNDRGRCEKSYQAGPLNPAAFGSQRSAQNQEKDDENNRRIHQAMSEKFVRLFQLLFSERVSQLNDLLVSVMWLWIVHFPWQMLLIERTRSAMRRRGRRIEPETRPAHSLEQKLADSFPLMYDKLCSVVKDYGL